jgi:glycosyltransferase involved in cell wall biosynthesis
MDWYLPGTKAGGPVRSMYSLIELLKQEYDFYLITGNTDLGETQAYKGIETHTWLKSEALHTFYFERQSISNTSIKQLVEALKPDLIYLNSFWSYDFSIRIIRLKRAGKLISPVLLAPRGMLSSGAMGLKTKKKKVVLKIGKLLRWYKDIYFQATQETEKQEILREFPAAQVFIAPNVNAGMVRKNQSTKRKNELNLFYLSRIARVKNLHLALECLAELPSGLDIRYTIYGNAEDDEYWLHCQDLIKQLPAHIQVNYEGELAFMEVQLKLVSQQVLFLPTLNENFGHSIVEALLCGCPVIISDQTPWNDVAIFGAGSVLPLADKEGFRKAIQAYAYMDAAEFSAVSVNANNYISGKIDLSGIKQQYRQLIDECTQNGSK